MTVAELIELLILLPPEQKQLEVRIQSNDQYHPTNIRSIKQEQTPVYSIKYILLDYEA
jgi:hypothetical protein